MLYYPAILRPQWVLKWNDECRESEPHHSKWPTEFLYLSEKESERVLYCKMKKKAIKIWQCAASYSSFVSLRRHCWVGVLLWPCQLVNRQLNAKTVCCLYLGIVWSTSRWLYLFPTITHVTYYAPRRTGQASSRAGPDLPAPNPWTWETQSRRRQTLEFRYTRVDIAFVLLQLQDTKSLLG